MIEERYKLAILRIREIEKEETTGQRFREYFRRVAQFLVLIDETRAGLEDGSFASADITELEEWNTRLYEDILPGHYEESYGNPSYAAEKLGEQYGPVLCALYAELRGAIAYV